MYDHLLICQYSVSRSVWEKNFKLQLALMIGLHLILKLLGLLLLILSKLHI